MYCNDNYDPTKSLGPSAGRQFLFISFSGPYMCSANPLVYLGWPIGHRVLLFFHVSCVFVIFLAFCLLFFLSSTSFSPFSLDYLFQFPNIYLYFLSPAFCIFFHFIFLFFHVSANACLLLFRKYTHSPSQN